MSLPPTSRLSRRATGAAIAAGCVALIGALAILLFTHIVAPALVTDYGRFPALATVPKRTTNAKGIAADPVNVAIVGTAAELTAAFGWARWVRADALSRASDFAIAKSVLFNRPDSTAPVSSLFLAGRPQDMAFEQEVGPSARRRHHVRLWLTGLSYQGRSVWIGDATFDLRAGISHRGVHPTHHIAPDVDEERDSLEAALAAVKQVAETFRVSGMGVRVNDHNAEGDRFDTDGELRVIVIPPGNAIHTPPADPGVPGVVALKDQLWRWFHRLGRARRISCTPRADRVSISITFAG